MGGQEDLKDQYDGFGKKVSAKNLRDIETVPATNLPETENNFVQVEMYLLGQLIGAKINYSEGTEDLLVEGQVVPRGTYFEVAIDNILANVRSEAIKLVRSKYGK